MTRRLAVVAISGLGISALCLSAVTAMGADDLLSFPGGMFDRCEPVADTGADMRSFTWDGGDSVEISVPATVRYQPGMGDMVIARGVPSVLAHLRVRDGNIEFDCNMRRVGRLDITLPGVPMRRFEMNGSTQLLLDRLDQPELRIAVAGSGSIRANGRADDLRLTIAGSGNAELGALAVKRLRLEIAGSGDTEVSPQDEADIRIAGSGKVRFLVQSRNVKTSIVGSGRIINAATPAQ